MTHPRPTPNGQPWQPAQMPPGWYPTPMGQAAYWDGRQWLSGGAPPVAAKSPVALGSLLGVIAGAAALLLSLTTFDWLSSANNEATLTYGDVGDVLRLAGLFGDGGQQADSSYLHAYFGWIPWLLTVLTVILAVGACIRTTASAVLGGVAATLAILIPLTTVGAFYALSQAGRSGFSNAIGLADFGAYLTFVAPIVIAVAAVAARFEMS